MENYNKYAEGKIYKLFSLNEPDIIYIGSTHHTLYTRLKQHLERKNKCSSKIITVKGNIQIELLESFNCNSRFELEAREEFFIKNNFCVNVSKQGFYTNSYKPISTEDKKKILGINDKFDKILVENDVDFNSFFNVIDCFSMITNDIKIKLIRQFEKMHGIQPFNLVESEIIVEKYMGSDADFNLLRKVFKSSKSKPANKNDILKLYVGLYKNIFGCYKIISSLKRNTKDKGNFTEYNLDKILMKKLIKLASLNDNYLINFDDNLLLKWDILKPVKPDNYIYTFGKNKIVDVLDFIEPVF